MQACQSRCLGRSGGRVDRGAIAQTQEEEGLCGGPREMLLGQGNPSRLAVVSCGEGILPAFGSRLEPRTTNRPDAEHHSNNRID